MSACDDRSPIISGPPLCIGKKNPAPLGYGEKIPVPPHGFWKKTWSPHVERMPLIIRASLTITWHL